MGKYKFSIIFSIIVVVLHYFHFKVEKAVTGWTGRNFALYIIYGLFLAFFLVLLIKVLVKSNYEISGWLLSGGLTAFFLFSQPGLIFKLGVLQLFTAGLIPAVESKKTKSFIPFLLIAATAALAEFAYSYALGSNFYYYDAWRNALLSLSGYLAGCLLF